MKERYRKHRPGCVHWELTTVRRGSGRHPGKGTSEVGFGKQKTILPCGKDILG